MEAARGALPQPEDQSRFLIRFHGLTIQIHYDASSGKPVRSVPTTVDGVMSASCAAEEAVAAAGRSSLR
uniref:Ald_Xan_dh_C2 domain-containing protein n=1 Tax=Mesocestoides corti TaxID=53468 RepID=A0A5K3G336_MESCO